MAQHVLYIRDSETMREVLLGSQEEEPPRMIALADMVRVDGGVKAIRQTNYKRVSQDGNSHVYEQEMEYGTR